MNSPPWTSWPGLSRRKRSWMPGTRPGMTVNVLEIEHEARRILQGLLDPYEEGHGLLAVDDAVIVGERKIHHRAHDDLAVADHRTVLDAVHAENARLRRVEDRGRHQRAVDAAVGNGEGAALHLVDGELAVTGA